MIVVEQNATFEAVVDWGTTGLVGTIGVRVIDNQGNEVRARVTAGIIENPAGFGIYQATGLVAPGATGQFTVVWDNGAGATAIEDLVVVEAGASTSPAPAVPADGPTEPVLGPCTAWTTGDDVAVCAGVEVGSDNDALLDQVAVEASMLLYIATAQQFSGSCERTVRPCYTRKTCLHDWGSWYDDRGYLCGCGKLSEVYLGGYPVTSIVEVLIDGAVVDPATYTLVEWQTLRRIRDPADVNTALYWPACQDLTKPTTEEGTWQVTYLRGVNPPPLGERAAAALGAELYRACPGVSAGACLLPSSVTSVTRQGVTMNFAGFRSFGFDRSKRVWNTGIALVDAFLNSYNPTGARRPAAFFSPDGPQFAERVL